MNNFILLNPVIVSYIWLIIAIIFLVAELATPGLFFFIAFAIGSCFAAGVAYLSYSLVAQCLFALSGMVISFFVLRYYFSVKGGKRIETNIDALVGQRGIVTKDIEPNKLGRVKVKREEWSAESELEVKKGTVVKVLAVKGNRVIVK